MKTKGTILNQRITIERYGVIKDEYGQPVNVLSYSSQRWCEVKRQSGSMYFGSSALQFTYDLQFTVRAFESEPIYQTDLIEHKGVKYRIMQMEHDNEGFQFFTIIKAKAVE